MEMLWKGYSIIQMKSNSILFECDQERMQVLRGLAPTQVGDPSLRKIR